MSDILLPEFLILKFDYSICPENYAENEKILVPEVEWSSFERENCAVLQLDLTYCSSNNTARIHTIIAASFDGISLSSMQLHTKGKQLVLKYAYDVIDSFMQNEGLCLPRLE